MVVALGVGVGLVVVIVTELGMTLVVSFVCLFSMHRHTKSEPG